MSGINRVTLVRAAVWLEGVHANRAKRLVPTPCILPSSSWGLTIDIEGDLPARPAAAQNSRGHCFAYPTSGLIEYSQKRVAMWYPTVIITAIFD